MTRWTDRPDHERSDADVGAVVRFGIGVAVLTVTTLVAVAYLAGFLAERPRPDDVEPSPVAGTRAPFAGPRLQVSPTEDLESLRREEDARLTSYGWVDRPGERVHIPIDEAMAIVARDGAGLTGEAGR